MARYLGIDTPDVAGATGTTATDLGAKVKAVREAKATHDFVFAHIKGTDSCGHDGLFDAKQEMIERIDREFLAPLVKEFDVIVVTGDHTTACSAKRHTADPVPFLFWHRDVRPDGSRKFCERECLHGGLGTIRGVEVIPMILDYLDLNHMFGE